MQHPRQHDVVDVAAPAGEDARVLGPQDPRADGAGSDVDGHQHPPSTNDCVVAVYHCPDRGSDAASRVAARGVDKWPAA